MIPRTESSNVIISGDISKSKFEIASDDAAHIMTILGSTLYSDKIAAVLREYGTNAIDAHVEAGIRERPISVNLPTHDNRTLSIRDYGMACHMKKCSESLKDLAEALSEIQTLSQGCLASVQKLGGHIEIHSQSSRDMVENVAPMLLLLETLDKLVTYLSLMNKIVMSQTRVLRSKSL